MKNYRVVFPSQSNVALEAFELPALQPNEMLVKTNITQISIGTELTQLEANVEPDSPLWRIIHYPNYPGYNAVGTVVAVGANVPETMLGVRLKFNGTHQSQHILDYTKSESYCTVPENVPSEESVFGTFGVITLGSIRIAKIRPGDTVAVFGAGLIGQVLARLAKVAGALTVYVTDVSDFRLSKLPKDPAFVPINSANVNAVETIRSMTGNRGVDIVFECTSVPALVDQEIHCITKRGKLIVTSSLKGKALVDLEYCSSMGITIIGALNGACHTPVATPADHWTMHNDDIYFQNLLANGGLTVREMITHTASWKEAPDMYRMLMEDRTKALAINIIWDTEDEKA